MLRAAAVVGGSALGHSRLDQERTPEPSTVRFPLEFTVRSERYWSVCWAADLGCGEHLATGAGGR